MLEKLEVSEVVLILAVSFFAITGVAGLALDGAVEPQVVLEPVVVQAQSIQGAGGPAEAAAWFRSVRPHCNPVEVETHLRWQPAPPNPDGDMYKAACYALAGRTARARLVIESLPEQLHARAAATVFEVGHPAADAGDEVAAGPLMELVVEYWPTHYMALYHAGAARFQKGKAHHAVAEGYLTRFLEEYRADDGWARSARSMLAEIG